MRCLALLPVALLAACGEGPDDDRSSARRDPVSARALADPLMTDPDLASLNRGDALLEGGGPASGEVPLDKIGGQEVAAARAAALVLAGGKLAFPGRPGPALPASRIAGRVTPRTMAEALPVLSRGCAWQLEPGFVWAARLPDALPVYPRGHARMAAGIDAPGCGLRVVEFATPVPPADLLTFYATLAGKAKLAPTWRREGEDVVLVGQGKSLGIALFVHPPEQGMTRAVLITSETKPVP